MREGAAGAEVAGRLVAQAVDAGHAAAAVAALRRRGVPEADAEDAVQEALVEAVRGWAQEPPRDPQAWLVTVGWRRHLDVVRAERARRLREERAGEEPPPGDVASRDDTLALFFRCAHPALTPASAVALTLRAVAGLTTRQIAAAYLVPEPTMAQRISRARRTVAGRRLDVPGDLSTVLRVLYLVFNEGHGGDVDLAAEAIRPTRELAGLTDDPEAQGLLALMLLHHARRPARFTAGGALVPLAAQDRSTWNTALIVEGIEVLQRALARDRLGEYQAQAAIAALHADAQDVADTDWPQIVEWFDELVRLTAASPVVLLNRAVAVGEADGPHAGLTALQQVADTVPRHDAVRAHLLERAGDAATAARHYRRAAERAGSVAERDHLARQAARCADLAGRDASRPDPPPQPPGFPRWAPGTIDR
ncbi:RNA polymerase sigma factor [Nocardioides sp.]|uniref:RNA polymerase sigma factor n=1 Tax=Nocardioides sp. TaxID=35761 RepID=UPI003512ACFE